MVLSTPVEPELLAQFTADVNSNWTRSSATEWASIFQRTVRTVTTYANVIRRGEELVNPYEKSLSASRPISTREESYTHEPTGVDTSITERLAALQREVALLQAGKQITHEYSVSPSPVKRCEWISLPEGNYALISDLHIPHQDHKVIERYMQESERFGVKHGVILGDMMDGNQFHPKRGGLQQHDRRYQDDVELAKEVLGQLLEYFEHLTIFSGNHDNWFARHFRNQVDPEWILSNLYHEFEGRVTFSGYEQCDAISGGKKWKLCHGRNFSGANPLGVAQNLAAKFECNVALGHQHMAVQGFSRSGFHQCICLGGAYDASTFHYIHESPSTTAAMTRSFGLLVDGYVTSFFIGA